MPTGYTAPLYDGEDITFEQFVLRCSRGMGAAIMQRDESLDVTLKKRKPSLDYHNKAIARAKARRIEARQWTEEEADNRAVEQYAESMRKYLERRREQGATVARYKAMLEKVKAWTPPTTDHQGLKDFMISQLEESIKFDGPSNFGKPTAMTGQEFRESEISSAKRDIEYHSKEIIKEKERCDSQNEWVEALADNLGVEIE